VRLVLDTFLPPGWRVAATADGRTLRPGERAIARAPDAMEDVLDLLVEGWVGLAHMLLKRGEKVTLVAPVRDGETVVVREIECKRGEERKWRAIGSDAAWQHEVGPDTLLARIDPTNAKASSIIVSAGLFFGNTRPAPGTSYVIADGASVVLDAKADDLGMLRRFFISDYPVGADDNKLDLQKLFSPRPPKPALVRAELARATAFAIDHARSSSAPVTLVRRRGLAISLETP
jgi:hypothetical protein